MFCNCCGSNNFEFLWSNFEKPSARHKEQPLDVMICKNCGLVCLDFTGFKIDDLIEYYTSSNTFEKPGPLPNGHKKMREEQVNWVLTNFPKKHDTKRTVLDIGCGAGYVLKLFKDKNFEVLGTDLSPAMIQNLKELYNIEGVQGSFSSNLTDKRFDLITCICVLEHVVDPSHMLSEMYRTLNSGGFVFIEVPDSEFPRWDTIVDHLAFDHLWHFTERTLGRLLEQNGFEPLFCHHLENPPDSGNPEAGLRFLSIKRNRNFTHKYNKNDYAHQKQILQDYRQKYFSYLSTFQKKIDRTSEIVGDFPIAIFCGGEHTATLMERFDLSKLNISCIYDNDPAITGKELKGIKIHHGSKACNENISYFLLSTTNHEKAIYEQLKKGNPNCKVFGLYSTLD